ncbi:MAG: chemotaxis protein CheW [Gammaproteobacteria bacterium]|nr:MAG: chemotaxis protein CheW [Gammaproteobacteria bacterium]
MSDSPAFNKLVDFEKRSREFVSDLPQQAAVKTMWSGVGFSLAGQKYVAPLKEIAEISHVPRFTQVPGVQSWVKGVANVRGRLMPVLDLMSFLNRASDYPLKRRRLLVIERGELYSGLIVDAVLGMQHFPVDSFVTELPGAFQLTRNYLKGGYQKDDEVWAIFSLHQLAQNPGFMNVAS